MLLYHPKTKNDWAIVKQPNEQRMALCDALPTKGFPAVPEHQIEQARRISHPAHQKYINNSAT